MSGCKTLIPSQGIIIREGNQAFNQPPHPVQTGKGKDLLSFSDKPKKFRSKVSGISKHSVGGETSQLVTVQPKKVINNITQKSSEASSTVPALPAPFQVQLSAKKQQETATIDLPVSSENFPSVISEHQVDQVMFPDSLKNDVLTLGSASVVTSGGKQNSEPFMTKAVVPLSMNTPMQYTWKLPTLPVGLTPGNVDVSAELSPEKRHEEADRSLADTDRKVKRIRKAYDDTPMEVQAVSPASSTTISGIEAVFF